MQGLMANSKISNQHAVDKDIYFFWHMPALVNYTAVTSLRQHNIVLDGVYVFPACHGNFTLMRLSQNVHTVA